MRKFLFTLLLAAIALTSFGQQTLIKDLGIVTTLQLPPQGVVPALRVAGFIYVNSAGELFVSDGTQWVAQGGGAIPTLQMVTEEGGMSDQDLILSGNSLMFGSEDESIITIENDPDSPEDQSIFMGNSNMTGISVGQYELSITAPGDDVSDPAEISLTSANPGGIDLSAPDAQINMMTPQIKYGTGTPDQNTRFTITTGAPTEPEIRFNAMTADWEISDDGVTFEEIARGAGGIPTFQQVTDQDATVGEALTTNRLNIQNSSPLGSLETDGSAVPDYRALLSSGFGVTNWSMVYSHAQHASVSSSGFVFLSTRNGVNSAITLTENTQISFNPALEAGIRGNISVTQDATGGRTISFFNSTVVIDGGGSVIPINTAANSVSLVKWYYDGAKFFVSVEKEEASGGVDLSFFQLEDTFNPNAHIPTHPNLRTAPLNSPVSNYTITMTGISILPEGTEGKIIVTQNATSAKNLLLFLDTTSNPMDNVLQSGGGSNIPISSVLSSISIVEWVYDGTNLIITNVTTDLQ